MTGNDLELRVVRRTSNGRRRYDKQGKRALVEAALGPGASVAGLAQEHGINANLLRKWITKYLIEREKGEASSPAIEAVDEPGLDMLAARKRLPATETGGAFVPVISAASAAPMLPLPSAAALIALSLHIRLSNGVELDLSAASLDELSTVVQMFGRMPCCGSTRI